MGQEPTTTPSIILDHPDDMTASDFLWHLHDCHGIGGSERPIQDHEDEHKRASSFVSPHEHKRADEPASSSGELWSSEPGWPGYDGFRG